MRSAMNLVGLSPPPEEFTNGASKSDSDIIAEFNVVQTNWYYRSMSTIIYLTLPLYF
jgi:hypothetical protein